MQFFLSTDDLNLVKGSDGASRAPIELALIAYSQRGESLNWLARSINVAIRPDQLPIAQSSGIPFHFDSMCHQGMCIYVPASMIPARNEPEPSRYR